MFSPYNLHMDNFVLVHFAAMRILDMSMFDREPFLGHSSATVYVLIICIIYSYKHLMFI